MDVCVCVCEVRGGGEGSGCVGVSVWGVGVSGECVFERWSGEEWMYVYMCWHLCGYDHLHTCACMYMYVHVLYFHYSVCVHTCMCEVYTQRSTAVSPDGVVLCHSCVLVFVCTCLCVCCLCCLLVCLFVVLYRPNNLLGSLQKG